VGLGHNGRRCRRRHASSLCWLWLVRLVVQVLALLLLLQNLLLIEQLLFGHDCCCCCCSTSLVDELNRAQCNNQVGQARRSSFLFFFCVPPPQLVSFRQKMTSQHPRSYSNNKQLMNSSGSVGTQIITYAQPLGKPGTRLMSRFLETPGQTLSCQCCCAPTRKKMHSNSPCGFYCLWPSLFFGIEQSKLVAQQHVCGRSESLVKATQQRFGQMPRPPPLFFVQSNPHKKDLLLLSTLS
jgi:hypothetical protein